MPKTESEFHQGSVTDSDESEYNETSTSISGKYLT